jgi:hypothetical protein
MSAGSGAMRLPDDRRVGPACPSDRTLVRLIEGTLDEVEVGAVRAHSDGCAACGRALVELARTLAPASPSEDSLGDRYCLLEPLGAGGMGVVSIAFDTQLRRKVAVKRLRDSGDDASIERRRSRFLREARLLASLSHPNVLTVHDVGGMERELYVVMELVDGWPLSRWLAEAGPRPGWREIVDQYLQAGRGLAAAHALDVVHRDVKPENILVARSGRVLIGDFGLAGLRGAGPLAPPRPADPSDITETGAVLGTPAYMAPEVLDGAPADARSDQFSFCTSLWESLHGQRPFAGRAAGELAAAARRGPPRLGADGVPRALDRVVARGLAAAPERRHPSMSALLAELGRARARPAAPVWTMVAGAVAVAAAGAAVVARHPRPRAAEAAVALPPAVPFEPAPTPAAPSLREAVFTPAPPRPARRRAPASPRAGAPHARAVAYLPMDADPELLLFLADGAHAERAGPSCLAALNRLPADAWPPELAERALRRRASCEMLRGRCDEGRRLLASAEGADAARAALLADCPVSALAKVEDRLLAVIAQADEARYASNTPGRRAELQRALAREAEGRDAQACLRREPGARACPRRLGLLARAYQVLAEAFLAGGDCGAGASLDVMRTEVEVQAAGADPAVGCRAERTRAVFRACATAADQAERRCVARVQAARHDGQPLVPEPPVR